ncbi:unnamed protein product, partial [Didymodactylos carnosus]
YIYLLMYVEIKQGILCNIYNSHYVQFHYIFFTILSNLSPPLLLLVFGLLTLKNVRHQRQQIHAANNNNNNQLYRRRDNQMIRLMLYQAFIYVLFALPLALIATVNAFNTPTTVTLFLQKAFIVVSFFNFILSFFINTLSATIYRQEFLKQLIFISKKLFRSTWIEKRFIHRQQKQRQIKRFTFKRTVTVQQQTMTQTMT